MFVRGVVAGLLLTGLSIGASAADGLDCRSSQDGCGPAHERTDANVVRRDHERDASRPSPRYSTSHRFVPAEVSGSGRRHDFSGYPAPGYPASGPSGAVPSGTGRVYRYRVRQPIDIYRRAYRRTAPRYDGETFHGPDARSHGHDVHPDRFGPEQRSAPRFNGDVTDRAVSGPSRQRTPHPQDESAPRSRPSYSTRPPIEADD